MSSLCCISAKIRLILGLVYVVCFVAQFVLLHFVYDLDKKKVEEMEQQLGRSNSELIGESLED